MSISAIRKSWGRKGFGRGKAHELYVALCDMANASGVCWPTHECLADKLDCCTKTIKRNMRRLVDAGAVSCEIRHRLGAAGWHTTVRYTILDPVDNSVDKSVDNSGDFVAPGETVPLEPSLRILPSEEASPPRDEENKSSSRQEPPPPAPQANPQAPVSRTPAFPWNQCLRLLLKLTSLANGKARKMLGKIRKEASDQGSLVLKILQDAEEKAILDPIPWILQALRLSKIPKKEFANSYDGCYERRTAGGFTRAYGMVLRLG